jgi:DHA2 family multidrug resistance protein
VSAEQDTRNRGPITVSIILAMVMNSLDTTIANVALPHIQGSVSASADQITWVLTSYIIAAAIMTPLSGWLADRIGRKEMFLISISGFTVASILCGLATNLPELVLFRLLQGAFGSALIPLCQAVLLDINPPENHGPAMALLGVGAIIGPVLGPALGGYLTETLSWRWCFLINIPIGAVAFAGVWFFLSGDRRARAKPFDFMGFGALALAVGAFQLVLDRGPGQDWFSSVEIWTEVLIAGAAMWVFVTHTMTAANPFFDRGLIRDRNFATGSLFSFLVGLLMFSSTALLPPMMQSLLGYPVLTTGIVSVPRGIGSLIAMLLVGQIVNRVNTRLILLAGLSLSVIALWQMIHFDLSMDPMPLVVSGLLQGLGLGLLFVPLTALAFSTLPAHLRAEGASVSTLLRSMGASVGISIMNALLVSNTQTIHSSLAAKVIPSDATVRASLLSVFDPAVSSGLQALNAEITRQATMIAYVDDFKLMLVITVIFIPLLLVLREPKRKGGEPLHVVIE